MAASENETKLKEKSESSSERCEELLSELNQMNSVLRERGERISRLETSNKEKSDELQDKSKQLNDLEVKVRKKKHFRF